MRKITIESLHANDKNIYPKYRIISRKVAKRLCQDLEVFKNLPKLGNEKTIGYVNDDCVILQNIGGTFRVYVYYPVNRTY